MNLVTAVTELCGARPRAEALASEPRLYVNVLSTTDRETSAALAAADTLAHNLDAVVRLTAFIVVPYPLELTQPPVAASFVACRCASLARDMDLEVQFQVCCCRDVATALEPCLGPPTLVVMGRQRRWWSRTENRLMRLVRSRRHQLVVVDAD